MSTTISTKRIVRKGNPGKSRFSRKQRRTRFHSKRATTTRSIAAGSNFIAPRILTRLNYAETFQLGVSAGGPVSSYLFNLNSIFDPNRTGTGHQPYGHDQLAAMYNRYRVWKTSWVITFTPSAIAANSNSYRLAVVPANANGTIATDIDHASEVSRAVVKTMTQYEKSIFRGFSYLPALNGRTRAQYMADDQYSSVMGSSPSEIMTLIIMAATPTGASSANLQVSLKLIYHVECFDPIVLSQS